MKYSQAVQALRAGYKVALFYWDKDREYLAFNDGLVEYWLNGEVKPYEPRAVDLDDLTNGWMVVFLRGECPPDT